MKVGMVSLSNYEETIFFVMPLVYMDDIDENDPMLNYDLLDDENLAMLESETELNLWLRDNGARIEEEIEGDLY